MDAPTSAANAAFDAALPSDPRIQPKRMFGMQCAFVNDHMFTGVFEDGVTLRLPPDRRQALPATDGVDVFEPRAGSPWREYVWVSATVWGGTDALAAWMRESLDHVSAWPPKVPKPRKKKR